MSQKDPQIQKVWQLVYDLLRGPGRVRAYDSYLSLPPKFDEGLLNDISRIAAEEKQKAQLIEEVRAKVGVCVAMGLFGKDDLHKINQELDKVRLG